MKLVTMMAVVTLAIAAATFAAHAQRGSVAASCAADIAKTCSGKAHDGEVRICLETNYDKVSAGCRRALDTTGGGRGRGLGRARTQ